MRTCTLCSVGRQQFCAGKCAGSVPLSDRLLLGRFLRADRIRASANHAKGLRLQIPLWAGDERGGKGDDRQEPREQNGVEDGSGVLQKERWVIINRWNLLFEFRLPNALRFAFIIPRGGKKKIKILKVISLLSPFFFFLLLKFSLRNESKLRLR